MRNSLVYLQFFSLLSISFLLFFLNGPTLYNSVWSLFFATEGNFFELEIPRSVEWHPSLKNIPVSIPSWAYDSNFSQPGQFRDPITNITGPQLPTPLPHVPLNGWPISKAQGYEDLYAMSTFFKNLGRPGYVAESGALDGLQFSVTWWFAYVLGWRSIHVEASPKNYASLIGRPTHGSSWGGRLESLNINAALCTPITNDVPLHYAEKASDAPFPTDGIWEFFTRDYKETWWPEALANSSIVENFAPVHCSSLNELLAPFEVPFLDLWIVDVEGGELGVLQSHDFDALPISVVCVEADNFNPSKNTAVRKLLEKNGFSFHSKFPWEGNPINEWYVHSSFQYTSSR